MSQISDSVRIPYTGRVATDGPQLCPHDMAFPAAMMSLRVLMGAPHRTHEMRAHDMIWRADDDYYFHCGVSMECFRMLFDTAEYFRFPEGCGARPVEASFRAEGIEHRILSVKGVAGSISATPEEMKRAVTAHLAGGMPALVLGRTSMDWVLLATGSENGGDTLVGWTFMPGSDMTNKSFSPDDCQFIDEWFSGADAVVLALSDPKADVDRRDIMREALRQGAEYLRSALAHPHGAYANFYDEWIAGLRDEPRWHASFDGRPTIDPDIWDLAERRCYGADFLRQCAHMLKLPALERPALAMMRIHDLMWKVNDLAGSPESPHLRERQARDQIVEILETCRALDKEAASGIESALGMGGAG